MNGPGASLFGVFRGPREVVFGPGQRATLGALTRRLGARAFICTDSRMSGEPVFEELLNGLAAAGVTVGMYDRTIPELPLECVVHAGEAARQFRPDVIVAIGGGSCLDIAKLSSLLVAHGGRVQDYYGELRVPGPVVPVVAMPTTAGTGSEVTPVAVLADPDRTIKVGVSSPHLVPFVAICDPELTHGCPPGLTASTGADALTHAIEAFTAAKRPVNSGLVERHVFVGKNALSDHYALSAIRLISGSLLRVVQHGDDAAARERQMLGALYAGFAFGTAGTAAAHAIQYPVGALTHTAHGSGVASLLPYVMAFNRSACQSELALVADAMGVGNRAPDEVAKASLAIEAVATLFQKVGIPETLGDLGLAEEKQGWVAEQAMTVERLLKNNPRPLTMDDMHTLVHAAFSGDRAALQST